LNALNKSGGNNVLEVQSSRRRFMATLAAMIPAGLAMPLLAKAADPKTSGSVSMGATKGGQFSLPKLAYGYDALEPTIDSRTMQIHHDKHHAAYVAKLNAALEKAPELKGKTLRELVKNVNSAPEAVRNDIRNQGGGHINHTLFWYLMTPGPASARKPSGKLAEAINSAFGSLDDFKTKFQQAGEKRFGSGWAWLVKTSDGKLDVISTANQDSPLMDGHEPILGNDVWEHAYYLKYQNKRGDYLKAWWNVVNWDKVSEGFEKGYSILDITS
jgi:Fe-Mn family superoxide dismutase